MKDFFKRVPPTGADEFIVFSLTHIITMIVALFILYVLITNVHKLKNHKYERYIRYSFVFVLFSTNITIWNYAYTYDLSWHEYLPIATCGWGVIFGSFGLLFKNEFLIKVTGFYGWGALLSVAVPNILDGPNHYYFYNYLYRHIFIVLVPFYGMKVLDIRFYKRDFWKYFYLTSVMYFIAYFISLTAVNPKEVNMFFTVKPAVDYTPLSWFYSLGHIYYFIVWFIIAAYLGYLWGYVFYQKDSTKK